MPRKPKKEKQQITVVVHGQPISVSLYPPKGARKCWYAYWNGLVSSKSTGERDLDAAMAVADHMVHNGGRRGQLADTVLSDAEFEEIQRRHFGKKNDPAAKVRAEKSLTACLEAVRAFRDITGLTPIALAAPDDCERFQDAALKLPRNWRSNHANGTGEVNLIRPNTVIKWSVALQAAFERSNRNGGKKCVRGVVDEGKLLNENPWKHFTWIAGTEPKKRQFDDEELISILDHLESKWTLVKTAALFAKTSLWIWARRSEAASLRWKNLRIVEDEYHFDFIGKWGVRKWARIPAALYRQLLENRTESSYVFAGYNDQLRDHYQKSPRPGTAKIVSKEFDPEALYRWFHHRVRRWSELTGREHASHHTFRKTALQAARRGEDRNQNVAQDARVSRSVMMQHYVDETDEELWHASNRTYVRILAGLSPAVAKRYGYEKEADSEELEDRLRMAVKAKDWRAARIIMDQLAGGKGE